MKRIFRIGILGAFALLAAGVLTTGCVAGLKTHKIPVNIGFMPVIGHDTRAAEIEESVPFPEDRTFKVWANETDSGKSVLSDETVAYGAGGWLASQTWPDAELSFTACWPTDLAPEYKFGNGITLRGFDTEKDKRDILVASTAAEYDADSLVTLNFDHILSRVDFRVVHSLEDNIEVLIKKIEMSGFGLAGDYNASGNGKWTVADTKGSKVIYDAGDGEGWKLTNVATYIGEDFYVIPQLCKAEVKMSVMVRVNNGGWVPDNLLIDSLNTDWQSGKQYTYTLNMTDSRLVYTTGISNWNNRDFE